MGKYDELLARALASGDIDDKRELSGYVRFQIKDRRRNQAGVTAAEFLENRRNSDKLLEELERVEAMAKAFALTQHGRQLDLFEKIVLDEDGNPIRVERS